MMPENDQRLAEIATMLATIHDAKPKASLIYARILLHLIGAPDRARAVSDLSEAIGRGRDSTAVQQAVRALVRLGLATCETVSAEEEGHRKTVVQLARSKPARRRTSAAPVAEA